MDLLFEIELDRAAAGSREASRALYQQLKAAIVAGRLLAGAKLPASRHSANYFGVSRNTASVAYDMLLSEGLVVTRRGSGTYVADRSRVRPSDVGMPGPEPSDPDRRLNAFWTRPDVTAAMAFWHNQAEPAPASLDGPGVELRPAIVDARLFPFEVFRRVSAKQIRGLEREPRGLKSAQGNQGNYQLRDAIRRHIALTRGVVCGSEDVVVTSGAQQAFDILARTLVTPGRTVVAVEDPGYPPMRVAFAAAGATLVPVGVDDEGLIIEQLPPDAGVICVCPSHQFPLGVAMSMRRRAQLIAFARRHGAVVVEDDYDGEFRYDGSPLEALRTVAAADVVAYVGTFSKCMLSALRLGFVVAPKWAIPSFIAAKNCMDWHCSTPIQMGVARFIADGHLAHHVRRMRSIYRQRRQLLLESLHGRLSRWLTPLPSVYGMHIAAAVHPGVDLEGVATRLAERNVRLHTFARYWLGPQTRHGLVFGYGAADLPEIARGLSILEHTLRSS